MKVILLLFILFYFIFSSFTFGETRLIRQNGVDQTMVLNIRHGWNLVSLPGYKSYPASVFFDVQNTIRILEYDKYTNQWVSYYSNDNTRFPSLVLKPGVGYWLKAVYDFNIAVSTDRRTSVSWLTPDKSAIEIQDSGQNLTNRNKNSITVQGVTWMKNVFRNINFENAKKACEREQGRLPTMEELYVFYQETSVNKERYNGSEILYWSSERARRDRQWALNFASGHKSYHHIDMHMSTRCLLY